MVKFCDKFLPSLSEHEGRLCLIEFNHLKEKYLEIYMMIEDHQWVSQYTFFLKDFKLDLIIPYIVPNIKLMIQIKTQNAIYVGAKLA